MEDKIIALSKPIPQVKVKVVDGMPMGRYMQETIA